jgi:uncharacterized membrane protein
VLVVGAYRDDFYDVVLVAHIMCAIIGFGAVYLNALYGQQVKRRGGSEGLAIAEANLRVSMVGEYFIYAVFVLGFALVGLSDHVWKLSQTWIWLSAVLYVVGIGVSHAVLLPTVKRMQALMQELTAGGPPPAGAVGPPPQVAQLQELGKKVAAAGGFLNVLLVVVVVLMVFRPGAPGFGF